VIRRRIQVFPLNSPPGQAGFEFSLLPDLVHASLPAGNAHRWATPLQKIMTRFFGEAGHISHLKSRDYLSSGIVLQMQLL
jgi:hypothetical protein